MKSFLLLEKTNTPTVNWSMIPDSIFYEGAVPNGHSLAISPGRYVVLDVDKKQNKNGFLHIPINIMDELEQTFHYSTKSGGAHYFILYTGNQLLMNKSTKIGLDLRIGQKGDNAGGYVRYNHHTDIRQCEYLINESSLELNLWLEKLFS